MIYKDYIYEIVKNYPEKVVAIDYDNEEGEKITTRELHERSNAIIAGLYDLGLAKCDKIAVLCRNSFHFRKIFWAAGKGGFVLIPVNSRLTPNESLYIIQNSEAKALIVAKDYLEKVKEIKKDLINVEKFFSIDPGLEGYTYLGDLESKYPGKGPDVPLEGDDLLWFQYTSGTTGLPKWAMHTQGTAAAIIDLALPYFSEGEGEVISMHVVPAYSFAGIAFDLCYQYKGIKTIFMKKFDTSKMMEIIEKYKVTDIHLVPVIINFMLNSPDFGKYDLSSLREITYGGAPMSPELLRLGIEKLGPIFMQDYGASEAGGLTMLVKDDHILDGHPEKVKRLASCGRPTIGADTKVLNEKGEEVRPGEIGELTVKSPAVIKGYLKSPELTRESLKDGRFYTGDLCTVDEEGYVFIKDRVKDLIISGGINIYPFEVESALMEHPAILDAAVIGIPDDTWGEAVCAFIVFQPGQSATKDEILDYMRNRLAGFKKPKVIEVVPQISRTLTGKILKKDLRKKYWEGRDRKV